MIPFHLVYDGEVVVPVKVGMFSIQIGAYGEGNVEKHVVELDLIEETRDKTATQLKAYEWQMCQTYNRRVIPRSFQVEDVVQKKRQLAGEARTSLGRVILSARETEFGSFLSTGLGGETTRMPMEYFHLRPYHT